MNETFDLISQPPRGLECPRCGCGHFEVVKVCQGPGYVRRRRECRHCGRRVTTTERIVGAGANTVRGHR